MNKIKGPIWYTVQPVQPVPSNSLTLVCLDAELDPGGSGKVTGKNCKVMGSKNKKKFIKKQRKKATLNKETGNI